MEEGISQRRPGRFGAAGGSKQLDISDEYLESFRRHSEHACFSFRAARLSLEPPCLITGQDRLAPQWDVGPCTSFPAKTTLPVFSRRGLSLLRWAQASSAPLQTPQHNGKWLFCEERSLLMPTNASTGSREAFDPIPLRYFPSDCSATLCIVDEVAKRIPMAGNERLLILLSGSDCASWRWTRILNTQGRLSVSH